jgi:hypothetical protein
MAQANQLNNHANSAQRAEGMANDNRSELIEVNEFTTREEFCEVRNNTIKSAKLIITQIISDNHTASARESCSEATDPGDHLRT